MTHVQSPLTGFTSALSQRESHRNNGNGKNVSKVKGRRMKITLKAKESTGKQKKHQKDLVKGVFPPPHNSSRDQPCVWYEFMLSSWDRDEKSMIKLLFMQKTKTLLTTRFTGCWVTNPISHRFPKSRSLLIVSNLGESASGRLRVLSVYPRANKCSWYAAHDLARSVGALDF